MFLFEISSFKDVTNEFFHLILKLFLLCLCILVLPYSKAFILVFKANENDWQNFSQFLYRLITCWLPSSKDPRVSKPCRPNVVAIFLDGCDLVELQLVMGVVIHVLDMLVLFMSFIFRLNRCLKFTHLWLFVFLYFRIL